MGNPFLWYGVHTVEMLLAVIPAGPCRLIAQKEADIEETYEQIESRIRVNTRQIFSNIWKKKIKDHRDEILCINPRKLDSMLTSQRGGEWWAEFAKVMKKIYQDCKKQTSLS